VSRTIPYTHAGVTDHIILNDKLAAPTWEPPTEGIRLSHHIEPPDAHEARQWAGAAALGGLIFAVPLGVMWFYNEAVTGDWADAGRGFIKALLIPGVAYMVPLVIRFALRYRFDNRTRDALPPPRPYAKPKGKAHIIESRVIEPERDAARDAHLHKLYTLALWAASETQHEDGSPKPAGYAPRLRRDGKGTRELVVEATGETIRQEEQDQLNAELEAVHIFTKHGQRWGLYDLTWTPDDVVGRMEAAFPDD